MLVVLWGFAKPFFKLLLAAFVIMLLGTGADLIRPYLLKVAIDEQVVTHNVDGLIQTAQLYGSTIVISIILSYGQTLLLQYIGQQIIFDIRQKVFYQLLYQRYSQLETQPVGKMVTRVTNDTDAIKDLYTDVLISFISDFIMIMGIIVVMVLMDWQLALVSFTVIPVMIVVAIAYQKYARSAYRLVREKTSSLNTFIQENLNGIKIVKAFARFKQTEGEYQHVSDEYLSAGLKEMRTYAIFRPLVDLVYSLAIILVLWFSNWQIASGLEIGVVVAFLRYVEKFFWPIKDLAEKYSLLQSALAAAERIWDLISAEKLQEEPQDVSAGQQFKGEIRFEHVWFAYEQEQWVLQDVSLVIRRDNLSGTIYVDGMDVRTIPVELLRSRIGAVFQEVHLFKGTIADNISLYNKAIANDRIIMAARTANIHDTIINMPQGYDTPVGYQGALLSMGQRQLLSFARAELPERISWPWMKLPPALIVRRKLGRSWQKNRELEQGNDMRGCIVVENTFSDLEGLRVAIEIEARGKAFYHQAYEQAVHQEHKDLFLFLMNEEAQHLELFTQIFTAVSERKEAHSTEYLFDPETYRYLTVLAESHIFPQESMAGEKIAELNSVRSILHTAMQAEKDSILLYDELSRNAKFDDARKIFARLKIEEQSHVVKLREMMEAWTRPSKGCLFVSNHYFYAGVEMIDYTWGKGTRGTSRLAFSAEDWQAKEYFISLMKEAGLAVRLDAFGNIIGRLEGRNPHAPAVVTGSHLDTVPEGGDYDGIVGVVGGLAAIKQLKEKGELTHPLELIIFAAEESSRFGFATMGSKVMAGTTNLSAWSKAKDQSGITLAEALEAQGFDLQGISNAIRQKQELKAFVELHIEQGPVLEADKTTIGIVSAIAAPTRLKITVEGMAAHSGTTPMDQRQDALVSAAMIVLAVQEIAMEQSH
ncbi:hypothetical protein Lal_00001069 [Lupinus albus]|nr:hypothetical protein Lal_00001069 [Lupinus albus]